MNKYLKILSLLLIAVLYNNSWVTAGMAENKFEAKIAIVDVQSILENSVAIKEIKKSIELLGEKISKDINHKENELKKSEDELLKKKAILSEAVFEKEADIFNKKVGEAQKEVQNRKNKLEHIHNEAIAKVHKVTMDIVGEIVKKNDIKVVIPSSQVLFAAEELNITSEVITQLNSRLKTVKINTK